MRSCKRGATPSVLDRIPGRAATVLFLLAMMGSLLLVPHATALAEVPNPDLSVGKTATNLDENFQSDVTLLLPAASFKRSLDVAFVLDGSTSTDRSDLTDQASDLLAELAAMQNLNVKVSLTVFGGSVPVLDGTDLLALSDGDNLALLQEKLTSSYNSVPGRSGSNLQAGVDEARTVLAADQAVPTSGKYMIILSDGAARMWVQDDVAYSQTFTFGESVLWNSIEDFVARYSESNPPRSFSEVWSAGQSGMDIGAYGMTEAEKNAATPSSPGVASSSVVLSDPNYYTTYEAATYQAATSIVAAADEAHVLFVSYPYHTGTLYGDYTESFKSWLAANDYVTRYDSAVLDPSTIFSEIEDDLIQLVGPGSTVIDVMGKTEEYDFDFIDRIDRMVLTVDGVVLDKAQISDHSYGFGHSGGGDYDFVVTYYPDGYETYSECFVWDINVPVTMDEPVAFMYAVQLVNPQTSPGSYGDYDVDGSQGFSGLFTNNGATLYPVDSEGEPFDPVEFPRPTVSYVVERPVDPGVPVPDKTGSIPPTGDAVPVVPIAAASVIALVAVLAARKHAFRKKA